MRHEEVLMLFHNLLEELQFLFIKKYLVPAAKRIGADLFKTAAPANGEVVSERKKKSKRAKGAGTKIIDPKKFDNIYSAVNVRLKTSNNKHPIDLILNSPIIELSQPDKLI